MSNCPSCGSTIKLDAKFCNGCGAKVELPSPSPIAVSLSEPTTEPPICPSCGSENKASARFCRICGGAMDGSSPGTPQSEPAYTDADEGDDWGDEPKPLRKRRWFIPALLAFVAVVGVGSWYVLKRPADPSCVGSDASTRPECAQAVESPVTGTAQDMYIIADANIRDSATAQGSNIVTKLLRGTQVGGIMQIGTDGESRWFKLGDGRGYIGAVNLSAVEPPKLAAILNDREWFPTGDLMLRASPSDSAAVLETIAAGTKVALAGLTENNFVEVKRPKGGVGYISATGLDLSASSQTVWQALAIQPGGSVGFLGRASDQVITLSFFHPPSTNGDSFASYYNAVTQSECQSVLNYIGPDGSGDFVFSQSPPNRLSAVACSAFPNIIVRGGPAGIDAVWKLGPNQVMSAHLEPEPEGD